MRKFLALLIAALGLTGCYHPTPADQDALQDVAAVEIRTEGKEDWIELARLLNALASGHQDLHVDDRIDRSAEFYKDRSRHNPDHLTPIITIWRGDDDDQLVAVVNDLRDRGRIWVSFLKGPNPALETPFREAALELITERWPDTSALPILPSGSLPLPSALVMTDQGYRIDRSRAEAYNLPPDSDLLANNPQ